MVDIWYKCVTQLLAADSSELPPLGEAKGAEGIEVRLLITTHNSVQLHHS